MSGSEDGGPPDIAIIGGVQDHQFSQPEMYLHVAVAAAVPHASQVPLIRSSLAAAAAGE